MRCLRRENYNLEGKINNRNSNIDMIRIVAMLLVVALHCMDYGGFIKLSEDNLFVSLNHTISICAVNCFALISGYLLTDGSKRWNKLAVLWIGSLLLFGLFCSIVQYFFSRKSYVTICVQKLLSDINKPILVFHGLCGAILFDAYSQCNCYILF